MSARWPLLAGGGGMSVRTADSTVMRADHVIVTASLGVLKAQGIAFTPPLEPRRQEAIRRAGFGLLNKVVVSFSEPFWERVAGPRSIYSLVSAQIQDMGMMTTFVNMYPVTGRPALMAFVAEPAATVIEGYSEGQVRLLVTLRMSQMFGVRRDQVDITGLAVTRWRSYNLTRGSYTYFAAGSRRCDYQWLGRSACPGLHFAGEHTYPEYVGTVHGAYLSGVRAADRVMGGAGACGAGPEPDCSEVRSGAPRTATTGPAAALILITTTALQLAAARTHA